MTGDAVRHGGVDVEGRGASVGADIAEVLARLHVAVVIPAYQAQDTIAEVLRGLPSYVRTIIVVDDAAKDDTRAVVEAACREDSRIVPLSHETNRGVGGAMRTGYRAALERGAEVVVKVDADGQMDAAYLPHLVLPIALGQADYTKGNRFRRPRALASMPMVRLLGNAALSFMTKLSSGYWQLLDPTNGYTAISREALSALDLDRIDAGYFFESSMLMNLGLVRAVVADVAMPARYEGEVSHLSIPRSVLSFAGKHARCFFRRIIYRHLLLDFSAVSLLCAVSVPLLVFGVVFGIRSWMNSAIYGVPATAGTVMLAAFTTAGGLYGLVQAMIYDILSVPQRPLTMPRLGIVAMSDLVPRDTR
jgi:dolichol-phosphate mannosyltransferase